MSESKDKVETTRVVKNPTGKGGFGEHPEHQSPGGFKKESKPTYWLNFFNDLPKKEFDNYLIEHKNLPMVAYGAYERIKNAKDLNEFREVANRTEGMPKQSTDLTSGGEKIIPIYNGISGGISEIHGHNSDEKDIQSEEEN